MATKITPAFRIRKRQFKFLEQIVMKKGLANLALTVHFECFEKQKETASSPGNKGMAGQKIELK